MARPKVNLNNAGIRQILTSPEVTAELKRRANAVASAARSSAVAPHAGEVRYHVVMAQSPTRTRALVIADHPAALGQEAQYRILGGALDAAKG